MESLKSECSNYRIEFDRLKSADPTLSLDERRQLQQHEAQCSSCRLWTAQTESILDVTSAMPQFDVSEALTQRILESVQAEAKRPRVELSLLLPAALVAGVALFTLSPLESLDGIASWVIGLVGVALLKTIVEMTPPAMEHTQ